MPEPELIQRQREAIRSFRRIDRARSDAEATAHQLHEQTTTTADTAHHTVCQNAETSHKQALAAAESQRQNSQRSVANLLDTTRNQAQRQIKPITTLTRRVQLTQHSGQELGNAIDEWRKEQPPQLFDFQRAVELLSSDDSTIIGTPESTQAEARFVQSVQLAEQAGRELGYAVDEWKNIQTRSTRRRRRLIYAILTGGIFLLAILLAILYQTRKMQLQAQSLATFRATIVAAESLPFPDNMKEIIGMEFISVPAGDFTMGSVDGQGYDDEHPQHTVYLDAFWIGSAKVTNAQYSRCVEAGGCSAPDYSDLSNDSYQTTPDYRVTFVNWHQASTFARWLSAESGITLRLPTEAEWEKSCKVLYWFTPAIAGVDRYDHSEWIADWYAADYYSQSSMRNPTGVETGKTRVQRVYPGYKPNCTDRSWRDPGSRDLSTGFRLVAVGF